MATSLLDVLTVCAVDCYAMISGYVGYREHDAAITVRLRKYVTMWIQVVTYSFVVTLVIYLIKYPNLDVRYLIDGLFPVSSGYYWYFTAYTALYFVMPFLNSAIRSMDKTAFDRIGWFLLLILPLYSQTVVWLFKQDAFKLDGGYCFLWLTVLYVLGAWIKKCNIETRTKTLPALLLWLGCVSVTYFIEQNKENMFSLTSYINPTIVLQAFAIMILCLKAGQSIQKNSIIEWCGSSTFGIYLLHENNLVRKYLISERFAWISKLSPIVSICAVLGLASCIFLICFLIERIRAWIMKKLHINEILEKVIM